MPKESKGEAAPSGLEEFRRKIKGLYPSALLKLEAQLTKELGEARSVERREALQIRVAALRTELIGSLPDDAPKAKPARKAPEPARELSSQEVLESARAHIELGLALTSLTKGQRAALIKAGELPKEAWKAVAK